jgi:hypothetical protein
MLCHVALVRINIVYLCSMLRLLVSANIVPSSLIPVTLMMEAIYKSHIV